jgi:hypothetical protein
MKLRLHVSKNDNLIDYSQERHIRFAVVDLDKSKEYPENFVCMLPLNLRANGKTRKKFSKLFGDESLDLAKTLLTKALKTEGDIDTKREIERRLTLLKPKPPIQVKCRICGNSFETKRSKNRKKICQECKQKMYSNP